MSRLVSLIAATLILSLFGCGESRRHDGKGRSQNADATGEATSSPRNRVPTADPHGEIGAEQDDAQNGDPDAADDVAGKRTTCHLDDEGSTELQSVDDVVRIINKLPFPVTLPCFLDVLPRPLRIVATKSGLSIQPALNEQNPRLFALTGQLILAVVPNGPNAPLLELSQILSSTRSVKAEIVFPVTATLDPEAPFERTGKLDQSPGTRCAFCHGSETLGADGHYESRALRPATASLIPFPQALNLTQGCAKNPTPRCEILDALFGPSPGDPTSGQFPADMPTMF